MKRILNGILASTLLLSTLGTSFAQENSISTTETEQLQEIQQETLTSGSCGDNAYYSFDSSTGTLSISGSGAMYDYDYNTMPWYSYGGNIKTVVIGEGITTIGKNAFRNYRSLSSVTIPNSVTSIGALAFYNCDSLPTVTIQNSVTSIGEGAFADCESISSISVSESNPNYCSVDGVLFDKNKTLLHSYPAGKTQKSYEIPSSVTTIEDHAFMGCESLTSVSIPTSVTSIGECAFYYCDSLTSVNIPNSVTTIGEAVFMECESLASVSISNSVTSIGHATFAGCESLTSVIIPDSVTSIGDWVFGNCYSLASITIPNSVTSIGEGAFSGCESLTSVSIPNSVSSIGDSAFSDCDSLTSVFIPDSVQQIGSGAFHYKYNNSYETHPNVTIYGYAGSYAQTWCNGNDASPVPFVAVGSVPDWAQSNTTTTPSTPTYSVSVSASSNGSIRVNQTTAEEGERVTLTVSPNSGYMIDSVMVKDSSGNSITCGYDWVDGVYTFLMPAGNVTITANFSKIPEITYTPTITTTGQGNASLSTSKPSAGDTVQVTVSPSSGYVISSVTVKDSSGNDVLCVKISDGVYQYSQPSGNVTIYVTYYFAQTVVETYTDINYADWYAAYASYAIENGLMNGTSVGYFDPYIPVSRGMVAVILASASGESIPTANGNQFTDVEAGLWYSNAIEWCKSKNIVAGYEDGRFGVNDAITREQMVTILRGFANYMGYNTTIYFPERLSAYTDSTQVATYARDPFSWALGLNYIQGDGNQIKPQDNATRAEFANLLNYFMESN